MDPVSTCPVCKHHCPTDQLRCRHGEQYFVQVAAGADPETAREEARENKRAAKAARLAAKAAEEAEKAAQP